MPKSIEFLKSRECLDVISLLPNENRKEADMLSVFERFCAICDNSAYLQKNLAVQEMLAAMSDELGTKIGFERLSGRDAQKIIWRRLSGDECAATEPIATDKAPKEEAFSVASHRSLCLFDMLLRSDKSELEAALNKISQSAEGEMLSLDMNEFLYSRPDEYHCAITYEKIKNNRECSVEERSALLCWALCRILMKRELSVRLIIGKDSSYISALLALLDSRKLYPKIFFALGEDVSDLEALVSLCLNATQKNVWFELSGASEDTIRYILRYIPSNRILISK